jgi:hypothetical protein
MLEMEDNIYKNKFAVKSAIGIIKVMRKVEKIKESERERIKPEIVEYKASTKYQKLQDELKKKDEDDDFKTDPDPEGYDVYENIVRISFIY